MSEIDVINKNNESLKQKYESIINDFDSKLNDTENDSMSLMVQMLQIIMLYSRITANSEKRYSIDKQPELLKQIKQIKSTYNSWESLATKIIFAGASIAGGVAGFNASWQSAGKALQTIGQGGGQFGGILDQKDAGNRSLYQFFHEELKRKREDNKEASRKNEQVIQQSDRNIKDTLQSDHQSKSSVNQ